MKTLALLTLLALAAAAPASAKNPESLTVCGDGGTCKTNTDRAMLLRLFQDSGGGPIGTPPAPAPYLVLTFKDEGAAWKVFYVPSAHAMATNEDGLTHWWSANDPGGLLTLMTKDVPLLPEPALTAVRVGPTYAEGDVQDYLRLFSAGSSDIAHSNRSDWIPIDLVADVGSPWTSSDRDLMYSPSGRLIERGTLQLRLADDVAADLTAARPLSFDNGGFAWLGFALGLAGIAAAALLVLALRRVHTTPARRITSV